MSGFIKKKCDETLKKLKSEKNKGRFASALNVTGSFIKNLSTPGAALVGGAFCMGAKALTKVLHQKNSSV